MAQLDISLEDYLKLPNPEISNPEISTPDGEPVTGGTNGGPTKSINWNLPNEIRKWKTFSSDLSAIIDDESLRAILRTKYLLNDFSKQPRFPFREFRDEDSFESVLIKANQSILCAALAETQSSCTKYGSIYMARGGHSEIEEFQSEEGMRPKKSKHKPYRPDWAGVFWSGSQEKPRNVLPGDTKLSKVFKSGDIDTGPTKDKGLTKWYWPIAQIFTYCKKAGAQYGYLITDQELVVVRLRPCGPDKPRSLSRPRNAHARGPTVNQCTLEFEGIPWTNQKSDKLTINLALWGLHLMAARDGRLTKDDFTQREQDTNDPDTQESVLVPHNDTGSFERLMTPDSDPTREEKFQEDANQMSQASVVRRNLSELAFNGDDSQGSPTAAKSSRKRPSRIEEDEKPKGAKRGRRGRR